MCDSVGTLTREDKVNDCYCHCKTGRTGKNCSVSAHVRRSNSIALLPVPKVWGMGDFDGVTLGIAHLDRSDFGHGLSRQE